MLFGADRLAAHPGLVRPARRLGLLTNDAARLAADEDCPARVALLAAGVPLVRLFSPEHGLRASAPDGAPVAGGRDPLTGLPVVSLYGDTLRPPPEALADLDGVLCDLPDVGARFYTYAWTLTHMLDACAAQGVTAWVLDRPNPLGGLPEWVEGPLLEPAHASFLGRHPVPVRHSLTLGELARLWVAERRTAGADVRVLACEGWRRDALWPDLALPFVPTSPAIRSFEAALLYPGICLFEATNLSVGRGSPLSFQAIGAPWLQATTLAARLAERALPGLAAQPVHFTPASGPHEGQACEAVRLRVLEPHAVRPVAAGLSLLAEVARLQPELCWAAYPTAANPTGAGHLERLLGSDEPGRVLRQAPASVDAELVARWTAAPGWPERLRRIALYE